MMRRRFVAAWVLAAVLTVAPSLALAAMACAPHCCPSTIQTMQTARTAQSTDPGVRESDDCRAGFASRSCCSETPAPLASFAPAANELPIHFQAILPEPPALAIETRRVPQRSAGAELAVRTSPLRLSVVLLI